MASAEQYPVAEESESSPAVHLPLDHLGLGIDSFGAAVVVREGDGGGGGLDAGVEAGAQADYDVVKDLHAAGAVGTYDAAGSPRTTRAKVHVNKDEMATRHGAWLRRSRRCDRHLVPARDHRHRGGRRSVGGVGGHLWRGISRSDVKEFGELIDLGQVAPVIVGESKLELVIDKAALKADKHVAKELDVSPKDVDKAVQKAATVS